MTKTMMTLARATMLVVLLLTPTFFLPARAEEGEKQRLKYGVINFEFFINQGVADAVNVVAHSGSIVRIFAVSVTESGPGIR